MTPAEIDREALLAYAEAAKRDHLCISPIAEPIAALARRVAAEAVKAEMERCAAALCGRCARGDAVILSPHGTYDHDPATGMMWCAAAAIRATPGGKEPR
jgi:UDP-N-acetylmuramoylalanine-D-glutamate ligase